MRHSAIVALLLFCQFTAAPVVADERPNILWLTCEDISADRGCYGVDYATTPQLDQLASESIRYNHAVGITGVCAVNRSCLITGMYSSTIGTQDMRSTVQLPSSIRCFPEYMRNAGYYCTNSSKKDYNFKESAETWDESSGKAHWRNRNSDQPFFAVFNYTGSHESQIWEKNHRKHAAKLSAEELHDPANAPIPPFHPDTPEVRRDWANYHDNITALDKWVASHLTDLQEAGLAEETIVFFYSDHGAGMPGVKKSIWNGGLQVPLLIRFPKKYQHLSPGSRGSTCDRLVSFVDFAPTALSLGGIDIPGNMQGVAFLGADAGTPRDYTFAIRDRMAEYYDTIRVVRDKRYQYHRNFMPHLPWMRFCSYTLTMPTARVWLQMHEEGRLNETQDRIFRSKPAEELYDLAADPHMVHNLLDDRRTEFEPVVHRMREALRAWQLETRDLGLLPESEMHGRAEQHGVTPHELGQSESWYPLRKIQTIAWLAGERDPAKLDLLRSFFRDDEPVVRWWATIGLIAVQADDPKTRSALEAQLKDPALLNRIAAAEALCGLGGVDRAMPILIEALQHPTPYLRLRAMNVLAGIGQQAQPAIAAMRKARMKGQQPADFLSRMCVYLPAQLETETP